MGGRGRGRYGWEVEGEEGMQGSRRQRETRKGGGGRGRYAREAINYLLIHLFIYLFIYLINYLFI